MKLTKYHDTLRMGNVNVRWRTRRILIWRDRRIIPVGRWQYTTKAFLNGAIERHTCQP